MTMRTCFRSLALALPLLASALSASGQTSFNTTVPYTQGSTGSVAITQAAKNAQTLNAMEFGVVADGATDNSTALQAAITAASTLGLAANQGAIVMLPVGTIAHASTIKLPRNVILAGQGESTTYLKYTGTGYAWALGDTNSSGNLAGINRGGMRDLTLYGPSYTGASTALLFGGDPSGTVNVSTTAGNGFRLDNVTITVFGTGARLGNNAYILNFYNTTWLNNGQHWSDPGTCSNCGEAVKFYGNAFVQSKNSTAPAFNGSSNNADYYFFGGSSDYNNPTTYDFSCTAGKAHLFFDGFHFEKAHGGFAQINSNTCGGEINVIQSTFLISGTGQTDAAMISLAGTATNSLHVNVGASQVASNEALTAFIDATAPTRQVTVNGIWWQDYTPANMTTVIATHGSVAGVLQKNVRSSGGNTIVDIDGSLPTTAGPLSTSGDGTIRTSTLADLTALLNGTYLSTTAFPSSTASSGTGDGFWGVANTAAGKALFSNLSANSLYNFVNLYGSGGAEVGFGMLGSSDMVLGANGSAERLVQNAPNDSVVVQSDGSVATKFGLAPLPTAAPAVGTACSNPAGTALHYNDGRTRVCLAGALALPLTN